MRRIPHAAALALALAAPAAAQPSGAGLDPMPRPPDWTGPIAEAFFADPDGTLLRPDAEIREGWEGLEEPHREQVRRDCAAAEADASDMGGAASGGLADVDATMNAEAPETAPAASEDAAAAESQNPVAQVCALVSDM